MIEDQLTDEDLFKWDQRSETWICLKCGREVYDPGMEFGAPGFCVQCDAATD